VFFKHTGQKVILEERELYQNLSRKKIIQKIPNEIFHIKPNYENRMNVIGASMLHVGLIVTSGTLHQSLSDMDLYRISSRVKSINVVCK
jgi:tRNA U54 and U55 pseudouridine synthase Pus10